MPEHDDDEPEYAKVRQRRELQSFAKQIISGHDPDRYPDTPPL